MIGREWCILTDPNRISLSASLPCAPESSFVLANSAPFFSLDKDVMLLLTASVIDVLIEVFPCSQSQFDSQE